MISVLCLLALQAKPSLVMNGAFNDGSAHWKIEGGAQVADKMLVTGAGKGAARQRYDVPGLRILWYGARIKLGGSGATAGVRLQCFDAKNRLLMDMKAPADVKNDFPGIYLKTQANTAYVILSIEKTSNGGSAVADDVLLTDDDKDRVEHAPQVDLDAMMHPIWKGDTVFEESALLLSQNGGEPVGRLMFRPEEIVSVKDSTLGKTYEKGKDFAVEDNRIIALKGSSIPTMRDSEFAKGEFPWTRLDGRHVFVTYRHKDAWSGPLPTYQSDRLLVTTAKLKAKKPLTIVAYGDSITLGINVSGYRNVPPYLPPWPTLFARELGNRYGDKKLKLYNASLGGMTSQWAKDNAKDAVAALDPDLVVVAFGMNDFWSLTPEEFRKNIEATMAAIRARRPKCEFLLVASMKFDPAYTAAPPYVQNLAGYADELTKLKGKGVALLNMTALSDALYRAKSAKDLTSDPMHPDDFLARWYAQAAVATLVSDGTLSPRKR